MRDGLQAGFYFDCFAAFKGWYLSEKARGRLEQHTPCWWDCQELLQKFLSSSVLFRPVLLLIESLGSWKTNLLLFVRDLQMWSSSVEQRRTRLLFYLGLVVCEETRYKVSARTPKARRGIISYTSSAWKQLIDKAHIWVRCQPLLISIVWRRSWWFDVGAQRCYPWAQFVQSLYILFPLWPFNMTH